MTPERLTACLLVALNNKRHLCNIAPTVVHAVKYTNCLLRYNCVEVTTFICIKSVAKLPYLFGAVAGCEEGVAVPPAAFECLLCWAGVIVQQVLLQVLHHAKD